MSHFPCIIEGRVPCDKCVRTFLGFLGYGETYTCDVDTMRNIVIAYSCANDEFARENASDVEDVLLRVTDDEIAEMMDDIVDIEDDNCCARSAIDEFPLDLLWMSIVTSWTMPFLSRNDLVAFAQKYCARDVVVKKSTNEELGVIIARGQLSLLRYCPPVRSGNNDIVQQLTANMNEIIGEQIPTPEMPSDPYVTDVVR